MSKIEVTRIMVPDDANLAGNVHGGTILKLIEEAGVVIATRHCNSKLESGEKCWAALAHVERIDFLLPMFIGEIAQIHVELIYASRHSVEVQATVYAENVVKGEQRLTNRATLWYVPLSITPPHSVVNVPPLTYTSTEDEQHGRQRYEKQKAARLQKKSYIPEEDFKPGQVNIASPAGRNAFEEHSIGYSQSSLIVCLHPSDCNMQGFVTGGVTMKMMDTVAGIVAFRHCRSSVVTVSIEAVDFHHSVKLGNVMTVTGRPVFNSQHSMDIEVIVDCEDIMKGKSFRACSAIFTFVPLDHNRHPQNVPPLQLATDAEKVRFEVGRKRYLEKKELRKQNPSSNG